MSRSIASGQYLTVTQTSVTDEPLTMFCWFKRVANLAAQNSLVMIGEAGNAAGGNSWQLMINSSDVIQGRTEASAGTGGQASAGNVGNDTASWHTAAMVTASNTSKFAYLDGTPGAENTGNPGVTSASVNALRIGMSLQSGDATDPAALLIAHVAVWALGLTDTDITNLHAGANPLAIETASLRMYYPMTDDDITDHSGNGFDLTNTGTTHSSDNPTVDAPPGVGYLLPMTIPLLNTRLRM